MSVDEALNQNDDQTLLTPSLILMQTASTVDSFML